MGMSKPKQTLRAKADVQGWEAAARAELAFALLVACADWPLNESCKARIVVAYEALDGEFEALLEEVRRHQVAMIVAHGLATANCPVPAALAQLAAAGARRAMRQAGESMRLVAHLEANGVNAIVVKGALLSQLLYGDVTMRQCSDIDLLVGWDQFERAITVLRDLDYDLVSRPPPFGDWRIDEWRWLCKDVTLAHREKQFSLELHHQLIGLPRLLPDLGVEHAIRPVTVAGRTLNIFNDADQFAYLCAHTVTSPKHRLKWLIDLRVMLAGANPATVAQWQEHSASLGTGRCTALAMLLIDHIWGQHLPERVVRSAQEGRYLARLLQAWIKRLHGEELELGTLASSMQHFTKIWLYDDPRHRGSFIRGALGSAELLERLALPRWLRWFYVPLRLGMFAQRKVAGLITF